MPRYAISSEEERVANQYARLIPESVFSFYFKSGMTENALTFASLPLHDQLLAIDERPIQTLKINERLIYWVITAYTHPEGVTTADSLMKLAHKLKLEPQMTLLAASFGNMEFLEQALRLYNFHETTLSKPEMAEEFAVDEDDSGDGDDQCVDSSDDEPVDSSDDEPVDSSDDEPVDSSDDEPDDRKKKDIWIAIISAATSGHAEIVDRLLRVDSSIPGHFLNYEGYSAFSEAASFGHTKVVNLFLQHYPDKLEDLVRSSNYGCFRGAAGHGELDMINQIIALQPMNEEAMVTASGGEAFISAARNGHLHVVEYFLDRFQAQVPLFIEALAQCGGHYFQEVLESNHVNVVNRLLEFPTLFAYAEIHDEENGERYVYPLVASKLASLRAQQQDFLRDNPRLVFDIQNPDEARMCFFMIRNLIRRGNSDVLDDIRFLLDIPAVRELVHQEVSPHQSNELIRLAIALANRGCRRG